MTGAPVSPFQLVGDPSAAACEGVFCPVPEPHEPAPAAEDQERTPSPAEQDPGRLG